MDDSENIKKLKSLKFRIMFIMATAMCAGKSVATGAYILFRADATL